MNTSTSQIDSQPDPVGSCAVFKSASPLVRRLAAACPIGLGVETAAVAVLTTAAVRLVSVHYAADIRRLAIPAVLVAGAALPTWLARREFAPFGLDADHCRRALRIVGLLCLWVFPLVFLGLGLLTLLHLPVPLRPVMAGRQNWFAWLLYQFLYVAVAEEVFFRGYVQANFARLLGRAPQLSVLAQQRLTILLSAACFALAHLVIQGQMASLLVFLPGLLLAWLFAHTRSLLAPVLFHGLANAGYFLLAMVLT
jgi:membrane protease YdiL (CAAX protease family)